MRLPSLTRHAGGQGVVRIGGKDYYCGRFDHPDCRKKYELLLSEYLANRNSFTALKTKVRTMDDIAVSYLEHAKAYYAKGDYNNIRLVTRVVLEKYSELPADEFGSVQFKTVRATLVTEGNNRSRQYVNKCMQWVLRMLKWCTGEGLIDPKVLAVVREIDGLRIGRTEAPETQPVDEVSQAVIDATLPHMPPVVRDMVTLQQLLGCRPGEICKFTPAIVDQSRSVWEINLKKHKTAHHGHKRVIYVGPKAQVILKPYLDRDPDAYCFCPTEAMEQRRAAAAAARTTPPSCGNARGRKGKRNVPEAKSKPSHYREAYNTGSYGQAIKYACKQTWPAPAELTPEAKKAWQTDHSWAPNQLRHSAGGAIREEFGLEHVAAILGHSDVDTSKIYAKLNRDKAIEAALTR